MLRIAIVDDSKESIEITKEIVSLKTDQLYRSNYELKTYSNPEALLYELKDGEYFDIFILDIEMPEMNGIDLARTIRKISGDGYIVFLTSHAEFAIRGYDEDIKAYKYVLKTDMEERLVHVVEDILSQYVQNEKNYYYIVNQHRVERLNCKDIIYVKKEGKNCVLYAPDGEHVDRKTIEQVKKVLEVFGFIPIDRGRIVNIEHIDKIAKNEVHMDDGTVLEISRANIMKVKRSVADYWGQRI